MKAGPIGFCTSLTTLSFSKAVCSFWKKHKCLCIGTFFIALAGYSLAQLVGRIAITLKNCAKTASKVDDVAKKTLDDPYNTATSHSELPLMGNPDPSNAHPLWEKLEALTLQQVLPDKYVMKTGSAAKFLTHRMDLVKETAVTVNGRYLHASYMTDRIVVSQTPNQENMEDFLEAMLGSVVFDLTPKEKLRPLLPRVFHRVEQFGDFSISCIESGNIPFQYFKYEVVDASSRRNLTCNVFPHLVDLEQLKSAVDALARELKHNSVWIHCIDGAQESAVLCTAYLLREGIRERSIHRSNYGDKLVETILALRKKRSPLFVFSSKQFLLLETFLKAELAI